MYQPFEPVRLRGGRGTVKGLFGEFEVWRVCGLAGAFACLEAIGLSGFSGKRKSHRMLHCSQAKDWPILLGIRGS